MAPRRDLSHPLVVVVPLFFWSCLHHTTALHSQSATLNALSFQKAPSMQGSHVYWRLALPLIVTWEQE